MPGSKGVHQGSEHMLGRPVLRRLGAATAPVLLVVVALAVALSRVSGADVEGVRPDAVRPAPPAHPPPRLAGGNAEPAESPSSPRPVASVRPPPVPGPPP